MNKRVFIYISILLVGLNYFYITREITQQEKQTAIREFSKKFSNNSLIDSDYLISNNNKFFKKLKKYYSKGYFFLAKQPISNFSFNTMEGIVISKDLDIFSSIGISFNNFKRDWFGRTKIIIKELSLFEEEKDNILNKNHTFENITNNNFIFPPQLHKFQEINYSGELKNNDNEIIFDKINISLKIKMLTESSELFLSTIEEFNPETKITSPDVKIIKHIFNKGITLQFERTIRKNETIRLSINHFSLSYLEEIYKKNDEVIVLNPLINIRNYFYNEDIKIKGTIINKLTQKYEIFFPYNEFHKTNNENTINVIGKTISMNLFGISFKNLHQLKIGNYNFYVSNKLLNLVENKFEEYIKKIETIFGFQLKTKNIFILNNFLSHCKYPIIYFNPQINSNSYNNNNLFENSNQDIIPEKVLLHEMIHLYQSQKISLNNFIIEGMTEFVAILLFDEKYKLNLFDKLQKKIKPSLAIKYVKSYNCYSIPYYFELDRYAEYNYGAIYFYNLWKKNNKFIKESYNSEKKYLEIRDFEKNSN